MIVLVKLNLVYNSLIYKVNLLQPLLVFYIIKLRLLQAKATTIKAKLMPNLDDPNTPKILRYLL